MFSNTLFQVCWLRESSAGHLDTDLGSAVPANRLELALMGLSSSSNHGRTAAPSAGDTNPHPGAQALEPTHVFAILQSWERVQSVPKWLGWRLTAFFGPLNTEERVEDARRNFAILSSACDRIREAAGTRPWVELYLPYFARREWTSRFEIMSRMQFVERHGWIQSEGAHDPLSLRELVLRVSAGVFNPTPDQGLPLRFFYGGVLPQPWVSALAARWGVEGLPQDQPVTAIDMRVSADAVEGWRKSPRLHHGRYHATWARVALSTQWILRRWNNVLQLSKPERVEDVTATTQALLFHCLRPWAENSRAELTYDVLDETSLSLAFQKAGKRLGPALEQVASFLEAAGNPELAHEYRGFDDDVQLQGARIADRAFRGRSLRGMLAAETAIINGLMRYSQEVKSAQSPRAMRTVSEALVTLLREQLARIFRSGRNDDIASAIFLEATAAMHVAVGGNPAMEVRLQTADSSWHHNHPTAIEEAA